MIAASRPSGRLAVCCDEAFRLDVRIRASWCVLVGTVRRSRGVNRGHGRSQEHKAACVLWLAACAGAWLACVLRRSACLWRAGPEFARSPPVPKGGEAMGSEAAGQERLP